MLAFVCRRFFTLETRTWIWAFALLPVLVFGAEASAATLTVEAESGAVAEALAAASSGDILRLKAGRHSGPIIVDKPVILSGEAGAIVDGLGEGNAIKIMVPDVAIRGLTIVHSGRDLSQQHSGIFVNKTAHRAVIENNVLKDNLIGVYLWGPDDAIVRNNQIAGLQEGHVNDRGNGIQLWNTPGSLVENNEIRYGRDGIFVTTSKQNIFRNNRFEETRFAIHYMYTNDSEVSENVSRGNDVGYALMYSKSLIVQGNSSDGDRDHGILLNFVNDSQVDGNIVRDGSNKCVFIYNSNKNSFRRNLFRGCGIGIHFTAGSEGNSISENAFIDNQTQVKYVGTRDVNWSENRRGNYWSDNPTFDLNGDGIADVPYRPNDMIDRIIWAYPMARLLLNSPAVEALRWAQSAFPAIRPGGVRDEAPLMAPVMEGALDNG
jgi:nitrous oxidase accessory protein